MQTSYLEAPKRQFRAKPTAAAFLSFFEGGPLKNPHKLGREPKLRSCLPVLAHFAFARVPHLVYRRRHLRRDAAAAAAAGGLANSDARKVFLFRETDMKLLPSQSRLELGSFAAGRHFV